MILDQPIWLQCVGADLAAESNILLAVIIGLSCGLPFLQFKIVQSGAQDSQGRFLVMMLRFLILALGGYSGWQVCYAHGRACGIDALAARAAGTENINP